MTDQPDILDRLDHWASIEVPILGEAAEEIRRLRDRLSPPTTTAIPIPTSYCDWCRHALGENIAKRTVPGTRRHICAAYCSAKCADAADERDTKFREAAQAWYDRNQTQHEGNLNPQEAFVAALGFANDQITRLARHAHPPNDALGRKFADEVDQLDWLWFDLEKP